MVFGTKMALRSVGLAFALSGALGLAVLPFSAEIAAAGNGNGNNGNGNGNGGNDNGENGGNGGGNGNGNGRGSVASELKGLNAAHANQNGLENASPNSIPGKLFVYQEAIGEVAEAEAHLEAAENELNRLENLTDEEIETEFAPTEEEEEAGITAQDKYEDAVSDAEQDVEDAEDALAEAEEEAEGALEGLPGGTDLSSEALAELHRLLGLTPPEEE